LSRTRRRIPNARYHSFTIIANNKQCCDVTPTFRSVRV